MVTITFCVLSVIVVKLKQEQIEKLVNDSYTHVKEGRIASESRWTLLHYACGENKQDVLKLLLEFKAGRLC